MPCDMTKRMLFKRECTTFIYLYHQTFLCGSLFPLTTRFLFCSHLKIPGWSGFDLVIRAKNLVKKGSAWEYLICSFNQREMNIMHSFLREKSNWTKEYSSCCGLLYSPKLTEIENELLTVLICFSQFTNFGNNPYCHNTF